MPGITTPEDSVMAPSVSPSPAPARKPRGQTRQRLLDIGLNLFAQKGVEGVTVSELEEAVGLKPGSGSFYRHFADKDKLLEAIIEREIESAQQRRTREQNALYDPDQDVREALHTQFELTLKGLRESEALINLLSRAADHFPALIDRLRQAFVAEAMTAVARSYEDRINRGEIINGDPVIIASVVQSTLFGYVKAQAAFGRSANADKEEAALISTLISMLVR